jgi:hypothetical protein
MALAAPEKPKINTNPTQAGRGRAARRAPGTGRTAVRGRGTARVSGAARESVRDPDRVVVEAGCGIVVYPRVMSHPRARPVGSARPRS